jgi:hypothetical protein
VIILPTGCPRGRADCEALARIESDDGSSFICAGENDGSTRVVPGDDLRLCFVTATTDTIHDCDRRDFADQLSVLAQAMSVLANR